MAVLVAKFEIVTVLPLMLETVVLKGMPAPATYCTFPGTIFAVVPTLVIEFEPDVVLPVVTVTGAV